MADKKITQLNELTVAGTHDVFAIVDLIGVDETKKITKSNLMGSPGPIGSNNPDAGNFTILQLTYGGPVNEISNDETFTDNSPVSLVTERAIKYYVDNRLEKMATILDPRLVYGDSTAEVGELLLIDTTNGDVEITLIEDIEGTYTIKKISNDENKVIVYPNVGSIDRQDFIEIEDPNQSLSIIVHLNEFYII